ncbi:hypothetical protein [Marinobacter shengliensis]|uniref:hypothetical protein n=1 Tax=Marinobacter shengliensis TaxID=1389223 RepID=UPI001107DE8C|nr:hypothetical protein [Marinobacter shengliensis]
MKQFVSPQGNEISGVRQTVPAVALADFDDATVDENGRLVGFEWTGTTDIEWNSQEDLLSKAGERQFEDDEGNVFTESQLHWIDPENGVTEPVPVSQTAS